MLKTNNFHVHSVIARFCLAVCVLGCCWQRAPAQQTGASPAKNDSSQSQIPPRTSQTVIDDTLPDDAAVDKMLEPYGPKVRALDVVIGTLESELKKGGLGGGSLGNFVTDGMLAQANARLGAPVDLAVTNSGGLRRSSISPGNLHIRDIFELLPFENKLIELELTGDQLIKVLQVVVASREPQAGARLKYRTGADKKLELAGASLISSEGKETEIDPRATYRIVTIDYLLSVSGGNFAILQQAKSKKPLGITIRDALIDFVKAETAAGRSINSKLDGRFAREGPAGGDEPQ
jgi:2',3'-cyclic-nucleotide 2'-phosphodiesterase (5'-nucleotidase family)